ncbi:MauE/DoxX family redox-associated membrane protein [Microbulbifer rhizosphaerae]|uniref:Methylamine utilization protein MauE n=1 Tax=Microbulbifer rhizosphaerae TaxID=1562603 RepID=A0A7W4WDI6_9GAMM|nr:MauE/DoxX family redox-associated membrane protein [Microbulbifer rhizosphaerae]MBB3062240.1 mannose/fructose/N-acetylgalactosamine-specific phosphotransferase system component IID [Microbulbifer rhizosphaerae]
MAKDPAFKKQDENRGTEIADYWPLFSLILVSLLAGVAIAVSTRGDMIAGMHYAMGFFLCVFALLKLFHPTAFADGFEMYDLLAKRSRLYGYLYPVIELILGLGFLSMLFPQVVYAATILILGFGAIGVISALRRGLDINCPCMGSILDVPLSTVTLTEDLGMVVMAIIMWSMRL